jgi:hypothetical protein
MSASKLATFTLCLALGGGCAQILGTDFDVVPLEGGSGGGVAPTGGGGQGGGQTSASTGAGGAGGAGGQGTPETLWDGDWPFDIVVDDGFVYWSTPGGPQTPSGIYRVSKAGGSEETFTPAVAGANRLLLHEGDLYFTAGVDGMSATWQVGKCSLTTLECEVLTQASEKPIGLAAEGDDVYYTSGSTGVWRVKRDGTAEQPIVSAPASLLLVAHGHLWGTALEDGKAWRVALPISSATIPSDQVDIPTANGLAELGSTVAVGQAMLNGGIYQLANFASPLLVAEGQDVVADMTSRGSYLYWANFGGGQIMRVPTVGGTPTILTAGEVSPNGLTVDDGFVYFTCHEPRSGGGAVRRVPLP